MAVFLFKDADGEPVGIVIAGQNDESAARELLAGKGKGRDERFVGHDGGMVPTVLDPDGPNKVVWRREAAPAAIEEAPVAGQEPDNRGRK